MKHLYLLSIPIISMLCTPSMAQQQGLIKVTPATNLLADFSAQITKTMDSVYIELNGPDDRWFSIGFGAQVMVAGTDVIFYGNGSQGAQTYDGHLTGTAPPQEDAQQNWIVESEMTPGNGQRVIILKRELNTGDVNDYIFNYGDNSMPIIFAYGANAGQQLLFHQSNRGAQVVAFEETLSDGVVVQPLEERIRLFPNPSQGPLSVSWDSNMQIERMRIFDTQAREVMAFGAMAGSSQLIMDVQQLAPGMYYLEAQTNGGKALLKFIKE